MRLIKDHILRNVQGNLVLAPISNEETDFQGMILLNHTGEAVCRLLRQSMEREELIARFAEEYDIAPEEVEADVDAFLSQLDSCHMLIYEVNR